MGKKQKNLTPAAMEMLCEHRWPGNIRELQNVLRRAFLFCNEQEIDSRHLMLDASRKKNLSLSVGDDEVIPYKLAKDSCLDGFTRQYVHDLLIKTGGNISQAARLSQLTRAALQKILKRYDIDGTQFRT